MEVAGWIPIDNNKVDQETSRWCASFLPHSDKTPMYHFHDLVG